MNCKICSCLISRFSSEVILNKYRISYFLCSNCGFVQTEEPYWLSEAYSSAINRSDVGLVRRNIILSKQIKTILRIYFIKSGRYLDYGAGYGLFVRLMRDAGFNFYYYDKHCENLFAKGFESESAVDRKYDLLTAFEVFEHLLNPIEEIQKMLSFSKNILFSTALLPDTTPLPKDWWYYGLDHGQHISLYSGKSLSVISKKLSLNYYSDNKSLHLFTDKKISPLLFMLISRSASILPSLIYTSSYIKNDYKKITGKILS